jgi:copper chaperone
MQTLSFEVAGMTCGGCCVKVEHGLAMLDGVRRAKVDLAPGLATVVIDPDLVSPAQIMSAINKAGFSVVWRPAAA